MNKIINLDKKEKIPECELQFHNLCKHVLEGYNKKQWHVEKCKNCGIIIVQMKEGRL